MTQSIVILCWLVAIVYATIPAYWLLVHPFVDFWVALAATVRRVGPLWLLLWTVAGLATWRWLHVFLYRTPLAWIPGGLLILTALAIYYASRHGFTMTRSWAAPRSNPTSTSSAWSPPACAAACAIRSTSPTSATW